MSFIIFALLLLPAAAHSGDLSLGFGYPYVSIKYDFPVLAAEGRYVTGSGIQVYSARGYWNFHRTEALKGFAGVEGGYIKFNTLGLRGTGYEGALFIGGEYRLTGDFYLLMDFAPTLIMLRHAVYTDVTVAGVEYVVNAAVYYRFGGSRREADAEAKKPEKAEAKPAAAGKAPDAEAKDLSLSPFVFTSKELADVEKSISPQEKELLKKLASADWEERRAGAFELGKIRSVPAARQLTALLSDENDKVRGVAALALGRIGDARALAPLLEKLKDASPYVRACAAKGVAGLKDTKALKALKPLLKDKSKEVRLAAKEAIEKLKGAKNR